MRRTASLVVVLLVVALPQTASAGGSWIDATDGNRVRIGAWDLAYASVGSVVTMRGTFFAGQQAAVSEGPWYAYLTPFTETSQGTEPMMLGSVDIRGDGYPYVAEVTFQVPNVDAEYYSVQVCDLGCTQGVGDLIGGSIVLAPTESEARLSARALIFQWIHQADVRTIDRLQRLQDSSRAAVERAKDLARTAEARADEAIERASDASGQAIDTQASLEDAKRQRDIWRIIGGLALLVSILALAWVVSLRRRVRTLIPGSPAGLDTYQDAEPSGTGTKSGK